ncbi:MAG: MarR family transcriptional regulator [Ketobacteraceae bacterium]|nr:MarR family transcriptional regulator [Ketobacteraceae bacterium]
MVDTDEALKLDNQFCFALYALSRKVTALYRPLLKPLGLTYPQYLVMLVLWERAADEASSEWEGIPVKNLCTRLHLDTGTLTPLLKRMEQQGLIQRKRSHSDEREVRLTLTEAGQSLKAQASSVPVSMLCQSHLPMDRIGPLQTELRQLLAMMESPE